VIPWLREDDPFPPLGRALAEPNGLLAAGASLESGRLIDAYRRGIFPWSAEGQPLLWWSPDPRMVLFVDEFKPSRSLRKRVRAGTFDVRFDTACGDVIAACAAPRADQDGTWITDGIRDAYLDLHRQGYVHYWSEGSTDWRSAACSSASRCSRWSRTPRRSRWRTSSPGCAPLASRSWTASRKRPIWRRWAPVLFPGARLRRI
jgi:hypothetical protein